MTPVIRLLVVDDHPVVRRGLQTLFDGEDGITVAGWASTADEAVTFVRLQRVDVVLMDLRLGGDRTGIEATRAITSRRGAPRVLVLSAAASQADVTAAFAAGAAGYLLKDAPVDDLIAAVADAAHGRLALSPAVARHLAHRAQKPQQSLTPRELEVLTHVASGHTNATIGRLLHVTDGMVKAHLVRTFAKLDVGTRTAAVAEARYRGLIS